MSHPELTLLELRRLVPAYVRGTLDPERRAAFERGLRVPAFTTALTADIANFRMSGADSSVPPAEPQVVRATPASRAVRVTPPAVVRVDTPPPRGVSRTGWYVSAVLAAALAAGAFFAFDLRARVAGLEDELRRRTAVMARTEAQLAEKEQMLATLLAGRGKVVLVTLDPTTPTGPGMQVFWNVRDGKAVVNAYGLAQVAKDRAYMLWMIRDGTPVPLKLFTPDESGRALVANVEVPTTTTGVTLLAVTEESAQGAQAPTMTPLLAGELR